MEGTSIEFLPLIGIEILIALGVLGLLAAALAAWRGLRGWWIRLLASAVLLLGLAGPQLREELRENLTDVAFLIVDSTESTRIDGREEALSAAAEAIRRDVAGLRNGPELVVIEVRDDARGRGSLLYAALSDAAAGIAPNRIAGAILLTDGQIHDPGTLDAFPAPVHALIAGKEDEFDIALDLVTAPGFGIVGETVTFQLSARALGALPGWVSSTLVAQVSIDGGAPFPFEMRLGSVMDLPIPIDHGGVTVVDIRLPAQERELTDRNNRIITTVNGIRDRLRVLLVSGEPHPGERTWRDLLKSDPSVDLIHFTILRPPAKQDGTPVGELSLIAFPTRELFLEKIDNFDLIVFDRYRWRGVLASAYLGNISNYVRKGGAVLVAAGPAFAGAESLARTPLAEVLPAVPSFNVFEQPFKPRVTDLGQRHPVTAGLEQASGMVGGEPRWGRWLRQIELIPHSGNVVMSGLEGRPLLILDRVGEGRVALFASDHAWLWTRGFEGGGPNAELLRRLAHWLMKEPELEEEALVTRVEGDRIILERRTLAEGRPPAARAIAPNGRDRLTVSYEEVSPGRWQGVIEDAAEGLWRFSDGELSAVAAVGPPSPKEFENAIATTEVAGPLVEATGGGLSWLSEGVPEVRLVGEDRRAAGNGWIGLAERNAFRTTGVELTPLLPAWIGALLAGPAPAPLPGAMRAAEGLSHGTTIGGARC